MEENNVLNTSISRYLNVTNMRLSVPSFQRNYSWTKDQVNDFWDDLLSLVNDDQRSEHFFGQIITYTEQDNDTQIIDGQQRLTTSFIFMGALKETISELGTSNNSNGTGVKKENIASPVIENYKEDMNNTLDGLLFYRKGSALHKELVPKLTLQNDFKDNIAQECLKNVLGLKSHYSSQNSSDSESENNIESNFSLLKDKINKYIQKDNINEQVEKIDKLFNNFVNNFKIVVIDAKDKLNAFIIFETINTRGTSLTAADIIKSHLLSFSQDDSTFAKTWAAISNRLKNDSGYMTSFVKTYVWAKYESPTERDLFSVVSKKAIDKSTAKTFLDELKELVNTYRTIININSSKSGLINGLNNELSIYNSPEEKKNELIDIYFSLDGMSETLHYPLVLALKKQKVSLENMLLIMNKIRSVIVRKNIISGIANNDLTKKIARIARDIWNVSNDNYLGINDIIDKVDNLKGNNEHVKDNFKYFTRQGGEKGKQYNTLAYLLFELYKYDNDECFTEQDKKIDDPVLFFKYFDKNNLKLVNIQNNEEKENRNNDDGELLANWTIIEGTILDDYDVKLKDSRVLDKNLRIEALRRSDILANKKLAEKLANNQNICDDQFINDRQDDFADIVNDIWQ